LSLPLQTTNFLRGNQHFSCQLFLELFDVYYTLTVSSMVATGEQSENILCTLIAVASFIASTNLSRSPRISSDSSTQHKHIAFLQHGRKGSHHSREHAASSLDLVADVR